MILATEYKLGSLRELPDHAGSVQGQCAEHEQGSALREAFSRGQLGIGASLAQKVQGGTVNAGGLSLSNFSSYAPAVDLINIPFWCGDNQRYANLVTSQAWSDEITPRVNAKNYKPLFYYTVDPRTIAVRRGFGRLVRSPDDIEGRQDAHPAVEAARTLLPAFGANPTIVAWGETPTALKQGVADALDPAIGALYTFGFLDIVSRSRPSNRCRMRRCSRATWRGSTAFPRTCNASSRKRPNRTQVQSFAQIQKARDLSMQEFTKAGCKFYHPTADEKKRWVDTCGEQRKEWDDIKKRTRRLARYVRETEESGQRQRQGDGGLRIEDRGLRMKDEG
jgi:TRAP-type C4-dicarboxylate transport system substrate-binding protein